MIFALLFHDIMYVKFDFFVFIITLIILLFCFFLYRCQVSRWWVIFFGYNIRDSCLYCRRGAYGTFSIQNILGINVSNDTLFIYDYAMMMMMLITREFVGFFLRFVLANFDDVKNEEENVFLCVCVLYLYASYSVHRKVGFYNK